MRKLKEQHFISYHEADIFTENYDNKFMQLPVFIGR